MSRIKLPGKEKTKKRLLAILVIIVMGILSYEALVNRDDKIKKMNQKEIEEAEVTDELEIRDDISEISDTNKAEAASDNSNKASKETKIYSARENELYSQAYELFFSHEYKNSINKADILISEFPDNAMGYNIRGIAKAYNGDFNGGMKDIDAALNLDGNYGYARFNKALAYELYGNMELALEWYNKALEVEEYVWTYYGIASIYGRRGDVENTILYLNKAITIDPEVKNAAKEEHDFDPVKNSEEFKSAVYN